MRFTTRPSRLLLPLLSLGFLAAVPAAVRAQTALGDSVAVAGVAGSQSVNLGYTDFYLVVPAGKIRLVVTITPGTGDADLYIKLGSLPTTSTYDCRSTAVPPTVDSCIITSPAAGTWYISLYSFTTSFSGYTVLAYTTDEVIALTPTSRSFSATQNGSTPSGQTVSITNGGEGTLSGLAVGTITYSGGSAGGWLNTSLSSTTAPSTLTLTPNTTNLGPSVLWGNYTATVPVTSSVARNSPQNVTVTYTVNRPATIATTLGTTVSNLAMTAAGTIRDYYVDVPAGQAGLKVTLSPGATQVGDADLYVRFNALPFDAGGGYDCASSASLGSDECNIASPTAGRWYITVYTYAAYSGWSLVSNSTGPFIALSPTSRTFSATQGGANPASQTVSVTNSGAGSLSVAVGTISYGAGATGWLTATLNQATAPATLTLQPATGSLAGGTYTATVPMTSSTATNSPQNVSVTFTVTAPTTISLSPTSRTFTATQEGANPASQTVSITNGGGGTLSGLAVGTITYGAGASGWLTTATLSSTTAPSTLTLQPTTGTVPPGTYTATVPITSGVATNSPQNVSVTFTVNRPAAIALTSGTPVTNIAATTGLWRDYYLDVPAGRTRLLIQTSGGTGDADLYVRFNLTPDFLQYDCGSFGVTTSETCDIQPPNTGRYYISIYSFNTYSGVTLTATTFGPSIALNPTSRTFAAPVGGANPASQTVAVTNSGTGTLSGLAVGTITYGAGATGWLSATLDKTGVTTDTATLTLQPTTGSVTAGTYTATVPITSSVANNSPQNVTVTFTVSSTPLIGLSPSSVTFTGQAGGASPASQTVSVTNSGAGTLSGLAVGTITYGAGATGWLTTATLNQTTAPATLTLQPTTGSLAAGTYTATVPITSGVAGNSPQNVSVTFTVNPALPTIVLSATSLTFTATQGGANPANQTVSVTNGGGGTLDQLAVGTITCGGCPPVWLSASLNQTTAPATLTLQPATGSLSAGTYTANVPITSGAAGVTNSPQTISVTFTISGPLIALSPASVTFSAQSGGTNPASQTVSVTNAGAGGTTLGGLSVGTITYGAGATGWLTTATLNQTTAPATLTLQPSTGSLAAGTYTATVPITSVQASNSPQNVTVTFTVSSGPLIALSSTSRTFTATQGQGNPASQTIDVTNGGAGTLSGLAVGTITYGAGASGWLATATLSKTSVTTDTSTLTLQPATGSLSAGTYTATVPITSDVASNSPQSVTVTFTVNAPAPAIALSPASVTFSGSQGGGNPASQTAAVTNGGGGTLSGLAVGTITYGPGATGWLTTATLNQTSAPATLTLQPTTGSLAAGTYTATVEITSGVASNSPQTVSVTFNLSAGPLIALSATTRTFGATQGGANPASQTVSVTNSGGGTLSGLAVGTITYGAGATGWLTASLNTTAAPATLTIQPATGSLAGGSYTATVPVTSGVAGNSPQNVSVTFTVAAAPLLALSPSTRTFTAWQGGANPTSQTVTITNSGSGALGTVSLGAASYAPPGAAGWLVATLTTSTTILLQPTTGFLGAGSYTATVPVLAAGAANSPQSVSVTFTIQAPPALSVQDAAGGLLGTRQMSATEVSYLDELGNRNSQYDLGDFLALVDRTGGASASVVQQVIEHETARRAAPRRARR